MRLHPTVLGLTAACLTLPLSLPAGTAVAATGSDSGWQQPVQLEHYAEFDAVSCASGSFCVAIEGQGYSYLLNEGSWSGAIPVHVDVAPGGVSCTSPTFCMAVDVAGDYEIFGGTSWSRPKQLHDAARLRSVSCVSRTMCMASDGDALLYRWGKKGWKQIQTPLQYGVAMVTCYSTSFCVATNGHDASIYNGHSWSHPKKADKQGLVDLSCTAHHACIGIDSASRYVVYRHGAWSHRHKAERRSPRQTVGVSCGSPDFCVIVDNGEHAMTGNVDGFGKPQQIDTNEQTGPGWAKVSCPTSTFCLAVNWAGDAITYQA